MKQNHTLELNKKAFTLIEVLISISLLVLIFTFIYGQFNLAQLSTNKTTLIEKNSSKREQIIALLYNDFISSRDINPTMMKLYTRFTEPFTTTNSLYGISQPYVKYLVVSTNESYKLIRIESHDNKNLDIGQYENKFYMDEVLGDIEYFKVLVNSENIEFFVKAKNIKDIYFSFKRVLK